MLVMATCTQSMEGVGVSGEEGDLGYTRHYKWRYWSLYTLHTVYNHYTQRALLYNVHTTHISALDGGRRRSKRCHLSSDICSSQTPRLQGDDQLSLKPFTFFENQMISSTPSVLYFLDYVKARQMRRLFMN